MQPSEEWRVYLSRRLVTIVTDIDRLHREAEHINKILRDAHCSQIETVPPTLPSQDVLLPAHPAVRPLDPRPALKPMRSFPVRDWPRDSIEIQARQPAVQSQSKLGCQGTHYLS